MLQFGDVPITQNSISKSRNPRNIWDRQTQSVLNSFSNQNATLTLSGNTSQNINATTGDFVTLTSNTNITDIGVTALAEALYKQKVVKYFCLKQKL